MTQGTQTREFNYVEDLADGFIALATAPGIDGELFNLGCGREVSMRDMATMILELMGNPITPEFGALPERPIEIYRMHADVSRTKERVGWESKISLEEGLQRTIDWYREALASGSSPFAS
jgi:nucleoside-diphosphate-sugar epimerase